ncbi:type III-B CRISPR-associated protein Cas10/Cmr2 [Melioribacter sp. OK-6-Me]|uniref:type III-B CRISPR-associated protein Cas10/Cmr2 n=1 Tax=unclassified Melioribacter TaxID=2627329 RepID=UPI003ED9EF1D
MKDFLFVLTISPVQSFIAQARKTKDLYSGSKIISDLVKTALEKFNKEDIIFPHKSNGSLPNRFVAQVKASNSEEIQKLGEEIESDIRNKFSKISEETINNYLNNNLPESYKNQIDSFLEIYWTAYECKGDFRTDYENAEKLLATQKNYRGFNQLVETGRKCSVCGQRNFIVINNNESKLPPEVSFGLNRNEGLCAVCFTKRFYQTKNYPPTAEIALYDSLEKIEKDFSHNGIEILQKYKEIFRENFDEQLLFEENLDANYFSKQGLKRFIPKLEEIKNSYAEIKKVAAKQNLKFTPYYSLVMFDADWMGDWISGKFIKDNVNLIEFQKNLSEALNKFSQKSQLDKPIGATVYAGGDDFMGFFNLNHVFKKLVELKKEFDTQINSSIESYSEKKITFTAGILISHYKTPLNVVIEECRRLEKEAKDMFDNKNAFAISVIKHSGEINKAFFQWFDSENQFVMNYIEQLTSLLSRNLISNSFIKNFESEFSRINREKQLENDALYLTELKRLINKSKTGRTNKELAEEVYKNVEALFMASSNVNNFISALNIADFISKYINGSNNENKN